MFRAARLLYRRDLTATSAASYTSGLPVAFVVGAVCAVALVAALTAFYLHRRRQSQPSSSRQSKLSPRQMEKQPASPGRLFVNNRASLFKNNTDIFQSVDLGRGSHPVLQSVSGLDGFMAARSGYGDYDPDAQPMTSFSLRNSTSSGGGGSSNVNINIIHAPSPTATPLTSAAGEKEVITEEGEQVMAEEMDGEGFYTTAEHSTPEAVYFADGFASAPSPLYHEFPAGEAW